MSIIMMDFRYIKNGFGEKTYEAEDDDDETTVILTEHEDVTTHVATLSHFLITSSHVL